MRSFGSHRPARFGRALFAVSLLVAAGCGGGGSSSSIPNSGLCDSNAGSISLARPTPGFSSNGNAIEIVASTNTDQLNGNPGAFDLNLIDNFGNEIDTGTLSAVPDVNGPHPYGSDFFYQGTVQGTLQFGRTYTVYLNAPNSGCARGVVGSFST